MKLRRNFVTLLFLLFTVAAEAQSNEIRIDISRPQYLRQGDRLELVVTLSGLQKKELTGQAQLQLFDALNGQSVDGWFMNTFPNQYFTVTAGEDQQLQFPVQVPFAFASLLRCRVIIAGGGISLAKEVLIPMLSSSVFVSETLNLPTVQEGSRTFTIKKIAAPNSETLQHHSLAVESCNHPHFYALTSLMGLQQYAYEAADQVWNAYFAATLAPAASKKIAGPEQISKAQKNLHGLLALPAELDQVMVAADMPWLLNARTEDQQRGQLLKLVDSMESNTAAERHLQNLKALQLPGGAFPWFEGGEADLNVTTYILAGVGRLQKLNAVPEEQTKTLNEIAARALVYLDQKMTERLLKKNGTVISPAEGITFETQYLYIRSYFNGTPLSQPAAKALVQLQKTAAQNWHKQTKAAQGMLAVALARSGQEKVAAAILKHLKSVSLPDLQKGRHWKPDAIAADSWWSRPVAWHVIAMEAFTEAGTENDLLNELARWLLYNKQSKGWSTGHETAAAAYALLLREGTPASPVEVEIKLGGQRVSTGGSTEGCFQKVIPGEFVQPDLGRITITSRGQSRATPGTAAVHWQYFEAPGKQPRPNETVRIYQQVLLQKKTSNSYGFVPTGENASLKEGDTVKVQIRLQTSTDFRYVQLKASRPSGLQPLSYLKQHGKKAGAAFYEETGAATDNYYFAHLKKGVYQFEYLATVGHAGYFNNGVISFHSLLTPQLAWYGKGISIQAE